MPGKLTPDQAHWKAGKQATERLIKLNNPLDAIFSTSDYSALGALLYLKKWDMKFQIRLEW